MTLLLGADFGTESVRVGAFDADSSTGIGSVQRPYETVILPNAWVEQDPEEWWSAFLDAADELLDGIGRRDVAAICVAATSSTVVFTDINGVPLRPAISWMDARAGEESHRTGRSQHPVMRYSGGEDAVEWLVPKAMWLAKHEPDTYAEAEVVAEQLDFINHRLTGRWAASKLNATCKWNFDPLGGGFVPELYDEFGVPDLIEKLPQDVLAVGTPVERVRASVVSRLRLTTQPVVAQGGIDAHVSMLGGGTMSEGELLLIGGTSVVHLAHVLNPNASSGVWGPYPDALVDGWWIVEGGQVSGGSILTWLAQEIFGLSHDQHSALARSALERKSADLLAIDHWMGSRTPYRDPYLRGALIGLTLGQDRVDLYRSCAEALAFGTRNVIEAFAETGAQVDRIVVAGGIRQNPLWLQVTADVLGVPLTTTVNANLSLVAGAVSAATCLGLEPDLEAGSRRWAQTADVIEPLEGNHERLSERFDDYKNSISALTPQMHRLTGAGDDIHGG